MHWLKENVYIAAWLALPVMVLIAYIQSRKAQTSKAESFPLQTRVEVFPLKKVLLYLMFLICFPMSISPFVEDGVRAGCSMAAVFLLITILAVPDSYWRK